MADTEVLNGDDTQLPSDQALQFEEDERKAEEERKKYREPPIVFKETIDVRNNENKPFKYLCLIFVQVKAEYDSLAAKVMDQLSAEDKQALEELRQYMLCNEGSWVVGDGFLNFTGTKIFHPF